MKSLVRLLTAAMAILAIGGILATSTDAAADSQRAAVSHGRQIEPGMTGPEAAATRMASSTVSGATLKDEKLPDYARLVDQPADYGSGEIPGPHILIENVEIDGALDISTRLPVVLNRVVIAAPDVLPWLVLVRPGAGPVHILWSDIGGAMRKRSAPPHVGVALALRGEGARVYRSRIGAAADGIQIAGRNIEIRESYIGRLLSRPGDHNDAVQMFDGAEQIVLERNRIENSAPQTSAVTVLGRDIRITGNVLAGGGWTLYGGADRNGKGGQSASDVRVEGNVFARLFAPKVGTFGPVTYWAAPPGSGNVWLGNADDQGRAVVP